MDEIDSIGSSRIESGSGGGDSEVQRTMLELLNQLDGFEATKNIKVNRAACYVMESMHMSFTLKLNANFCDLKKLFESFKMSTHTIGLNRGDKIPLLWLKAYPG